MSCRMNPAFLPNQCNLAYRNVKVCSPLAEPQMRALAYLRTGPVAPKQGEGGRNRQTPASRLPMTE
jgi:hypothetical protein